ncbi:MAG: undecaprenyldiphospho-muramoylpentapeptide beta-N-acetylglucosaminyltransferase [Clostridia bacterium]|nr:undecaprenyldiphospho-muramoylpentapeptide beta-N-acetylglucosaminyltransferase [Clostridia bacterium]
MKTIVLAGGGTAGHVMPNLALIPELKKYFQKIVYIGTTNGIENKILKNIKNIDFKTIDTPRFIRKLTFKNLAIPFKLLKSIKEARKMLKDINPNIVFSKGGYVSIPVAIAAWSLKIPVLTHESDFSLGLANKLISKFAKYTLTSFEETAKNKKKFIYSGSPIREQIFKGNSQNLKLNFDNNKKTLLILGGSLGAKAINDFIDYYLDKLLLNYNILHITGKGKLNNKKIKNYFAVEYVDNIEDYFSVADYVISRAGANVVFELMALEKLTVFIPLPKKESRGDQIQNAKYFFNKNMCEILLQDELNINNLLKTLNNLEKNEKIIKNNIKKLNFKENNRKIINLIIKNSKK